MERKTIKFTVTEVEYEALQEKATACGMKINPYCRDLALKEIGMKKKRKSNYQDDLLQILQAHTKEICALRTPIEQLILTFIEDKIVYRESIKEIENRVFEIENKEVELLKTVRKHFRKGRETDGNTN